MKPSPAERMLERCGPVTGSVVTIAPHRPALTPDPTSARVRDIWTAGDFGRIAVGFASGAAAFVERLGMAPGTEVLDVACGTGNLAIPAARLGARVTGLDIARNLLDAARLESSRQQLRIQFDEGDAEHLPYDDRSFSVAMSMFGVMFTARPERAMAELMRVTRPGGRIALANWTPDGFIGSMLRTVSAAVPKPPGVPSVLDWGNEAVMRGRLAAYAVQIRDMHFVPRRITLAYPLSPAEVVQLFREYYGPTVRAFDVLTPAARAALFAALLDLWTTHNMATDGSTAVEADYLDIELHLA